MTDSSLLKDLSLPAKRNGTQKEPPAEWEAEGSFRENYYPKKVNNRFTEPEEESQA
ncbi:hypothetical protein [Eubacterium ramulus]